MLPLLRPQQLFADIDRLTTDMFGAAATHPASIHARSLFGGPAISFDEDDTGYTLHVELPGIDPDNIGVELTRRRLELNIDQQDAGRHVEIHRVFTLPADVDVEETVARSHEGLLTVTLPKRDIDPPRRLTITRGAAGDMGDMGDEDTED